MEVTEKINAAAKEARSAASTGMEEIKDKILGLEKVGIDDISHPSPKVKQTALKSQKNFIISMEKTLSTELPEDPDLLYAALVELIRSIANNMRRQGKYLHPAFPAEMKDIKSSLDVIGRALNKMTEEFKPSVELREKIRRSKADFEKVVSAAAESRDIESARVAFNEKLDSLDKSRIDLESERKEILSSGKYLEYGALSKELDSLCEEKGEISGRYGSFLVACDNVLRKTAYIAEKNGDIEISKGLDYLVLLLHSGEQKDSKEASEIYSNLYQYIREVISANDSLIKNKHESQLFSSGDSFISQLDEICLAYSAVISEISLVKEKLSSLAVVVDIQSLDERITGIEADIKRINGEIDSGKSRRQSLEESVPGIIEDMQVLLSEIDGGDILIEGDWGESVSVQ